MPSLSVYLSVRSEPSTYTLPPFFRYSPTISARRPKNLTLCHSVRSLTSPVDLSVHFSFVARLTLATAEPDDVYLTSGSCPKVPTMMTLLMPFMSLSSERSQPGCRDLDDALLSA